MSQAANTFLVNRFSAAIKGNLAERRKGRWRRFADGLIIMIILTAAALCVSVYLRAKSELSSALTNHEAAQSRVDELKIEVERRKREVEQLKTDDREIEKLARLKFGFVRKGDIVIKLPEEKKEALSLQVATLTPQGTKAYTKASN